jgi:hypothetical protein
MKTEDKKEKPKVSLEGRLFDIAFWSFLTVLPLGIAAATLYYANFY